MACRYTARRMTADAEPWATLEIRLHDAGDGDWNAAGERLEALAALLADDERALGVETRDMSTLGQQTLHPELVVYTRPDALEGLGELATRLAEQLRLTLVQVPTVRTDDDWRDTWKQFYSPIVYGDGALLLRPSWIERRPGDPPLELILDPGRAFGTGQHETTAGCLAMLTHMKREGVVVRNLADIGTGTGLLAFAALDLWPRALATASDIDAVCVDVVQDNDRATEVAELDAALLTDDLPPEAYADPGFLQFIKSDPSRTSPTLNQ